MKVSEGGEIQAVIKGENTGAGISGRELGISVAAKTHICKQLRDPSEGVEVAR